MRSYRVTVRGRFQALTDEQRRVLRDEASEHDALDAAFTEEGTFTYDDFLSAFSFRSLVVDDAPEPEVATANARTAAELAAVEYLASKGLGYGDLRVESTSVDDVKASTRRLQG